MSLTPSPLGPVQLEQALAAIVDASRKGGDYGERGLLVPDNYQDPFDDDIAKYYLNEAWRNMLALLEASGLTSLQDQAKQDFKAFKKNPLDSEMGPEEPYLVWPDKIRRYHDVLANLYLPPKKAQAKAADPKLVAILERSEKYVLSQAIFDWVPCSEADVHDRIEELLGCVYQRILRKPPMAKPIKNFVPDTGLPDIKTLVEYKYVASAEDAKRIVDEILADLGGYQSNDYEQFVFVIYETRRFARLKEWEDVLAQSKPPTPTKVVLLKGVVPTEDDKAKSKQNRDQVLAVNKKAAKKVAKKAHEKAVK